MPKGICRAEATLTVKKIKPVALGVIELCLSEGISQLLSQLLIQSLLIKFILKFCSNLLKVFRVNLKACLGLVLPNQYCLIIVMGN